MSNSNVKLLNDFIVYSIEPTSSEKSITELHHFIELRNSNEIHLKKDFDYENISQRIFDFNIVAYNHDQNEKVSRHSSRDSQNKMKKFEIDGEDFNAFYSTARVVLVINDLNDESPRFLLNKTDYSFDLYTDEVRSGKIIGQLFAYDPDREDRDSLVFEIEPTNKAASFFYLNKVKPIDKDDLMNLQAITIMTKRELTPTKYELSIKVSDKANHIEKCRVWINFKLRDPPLPTVQWFENDKKTSDNNMLVVRLKKSQLVSKENKKVLSLKAKIADSLSFDPNQLRYKQLDNGTFFKVNELNGDIFYTDDLVNDNGKTKSANVLVQPVYINANVQPQEFYYLPKMICVNFILNSESKNAVPKFIVPSNNHTVIDINFKNDNPNLTNSNEVLFKFTALNLDDLTINDNFEYKLLESSILKNYTIQDIYEDYDQNTEDKGKVFFF
jgi:hypothetical protein